MKTINEWNRLKLTFAEKVTLLQNRLYSLSSAYATSVSAYPANYVGGTNAGLSTDPNVLMGEIDDIWNEMKSDIKEAKKKKPAKAK